MQFFAEFFFFLAFCDFFETAIIISSLLYSEFVAEFFWQIFVATYKAHISRKVTMYFFVLTILLQFQQSMQALHLHNAQ